MADTGLIVPDGLMRRIQRSIDIIRRAFSHLRFEDLSEILYILKTYRVGHLRHFKLSTFQEGTGFFHSELPDKIRRGHAGKRLEFPEKLNAAHVYLFAQKV